MKPCIQYEADKWSDGAGAQIQRIAAIYSISRDLRLNYLHQEIIHIESNPGDGFETQQAKNDFIKKLNKDFQIPSSNCSRPHTRITLKYHKIMKFRLSARLYFFAIGTLGFFSRKHFLYICANPYPIIENYPKIYRHFTERFGKKDRRNENWIDIQLHVRSKKNGNQLMNSRHVEVNWYVEILRSIDAVLQNLDIGYRVTIHTDAPSEPINWEPLDISPATEEFWKSADVMNSDRKIALQPIDFKKEFSFVEELNVIRSINPVQAWAMMAAADVLILGRSSFSVIAGLVNSHGLKIAPTFRHRLPNGWLVKEEMSEFSNTDRTYIENFFKSLATKIREST